MRRQWGLEPIVSFLVGKSPGETRYRPLAHLLLALSAGHVAHAHTLIAAYEARRRDMTTGRERVEYKAEEVTARAQEEGQQMGYRVEKQGEQLKETVAGRLHATAERLREQSQEQGQPALSRVAEPMERSAQYLSSHSLSEISQDAQKTAQEHPLWTAAGVFATAFLVGRLFRRR